MTRTPPRWTLLTAALSALMIGVVGVAAAGSNGDGEASDAPISAPTNLSQMRPAQDFNSESDSSPAAASSDQASTAGIPATALAAANPQARSSLSTSTVLDSPEGDVSAEQAEAAVNAHENGHGCDDLIHAADAAPGAGGPVGCDVGNSGDHRQNGVSDDDAGADAASPEDASTPAQDKADPHANGHGCDDVNHANGEHEPTHGGPVGCDVGNSGDHRQNGADHGPADDGSAPSATTGAENAPAGKGPKK